MSNSSDSTKGGETIEIREPFICSIIDELDIDLKDAFLTRTITYLGQSLEKPAEFTLPELSYSLYFLDFECFKNGEKINHKESVKYFTNTITIPPDEDKKTNSLTAVLKKDEKLVIKIKCRWKNFFSNFSDFSFYFFYSHKATYELRMTGYNFEERLFLMLGSSNGKDWEKITLNKDYFVNKDTVIINGNVSLQNHFQVRVLSPPTPKTLPIIDALLKTDDVEKKIFSNYIIVLIQHLLGDFLHLIDTLEKCGANKELVLICGIPYSTKDTTIEFLKINGYGDNLYTPKEYDEFYNSVIKQLIIKAIELCKEQDKGGILVIEDGGYIFPEIHTNSEFKSDINLFKLVVEQTTNGILRAEELIKNNIDFKIPLINVAKSLIKSKYEAPLIGNAVVNNIEAILAKQYTGLKGKSVGIIGGGTIGEEILKRLESREAIVSFFDELESKEYKLNLIGKHSEDSLIDAIKNKDIIIECSGSNKTWCNAKEIEKIPQASYFINASSKRLGMNYKDLDDLKKDKVNLIGVGKRYTLHKKDKVITLLADGYPINFFMGESVPDYQIQFIIAVLFFAAKIGLEKINELKKKIIDMNNTEDPYGFLTIQNEIEKQLPHLPG